MSNKTTDIVLVIDMQHGFCTSDSCEETYRKAEAFILKNFDKYYIFSKFINADKSPFREILHWRKMTKDTRDTDIALTLSPTIHFPIFDKNFYGIAQNEEVLSHLKSLNDRGLLGSLYVIGVDTDCCILKTAIDLFESGINVKVIKDLCNSSGGNKYHEAGLLCLERLIGRDNIILSNEINKQTSERID